MRAHTDFIILLILILLVALGPALLAVVSQEIAEKVFGCEVNLNYTIPCVISRQGLWANVLRSRLSHLVFLSVAAYRRCAARHLGGRRSHRLHREQAQTEA